MKATRIHRGKLWSHGALPAAHRAEDKESSGISSLPWQKVLFKHAIFYSLAKISVLGKHKLRSLDDIL